ncbi:MAG TPA: 50S ribosomal protein L29 [Acidimicrobiales bacterium]|nr:50S ribosomal protein L29 [Acidimicrobiales bacterium]
MADTIVRDLDDESLMTRLADARQELFNLRFQKATGQLTNTARIAQVKREVARCLTEARSREIAAAERLAAQSDATSEG